MSTELTFEFVSTAWVAKASNYISYRYRSHGVESDDVSQEIYAWLYGTGLAKVERWLAREPQQRTRIYRSFLDVGMKYAEKEKAVKAGYRVDDVWWYTPSVIEGLMPLVLDPTYTQENQAIGEMITMVVDIRRVLRVDDSEWFTENDSTHVDYDERIRTLVDRLGGAKTYVGRRKVITNAAANAMTSGAIE